ncbi:MAG: nucleotide sugar dehydrogenase [Candidatus Izemoplasmataceae bacterium]
MSLKYAIIGCGRISPNHIAAAIDNELEIVALCDLDSVKCKNIKEVFKLPNSTKIYTDYKEMLRKENLDIIAIATESGNHSSIALDCIENDINLIIEKPIALSLVDADIIIKNAKEHNVKVSACHQNRFNKSIQKIRESVENNRFGKLLHGAAHIRWNREKDYYSQAPWRGTWEQDGGALMNQCIHNIDLLRWMMGDEIEEVIGMTDNLMHDFIEAEDLGLALIKFKNGSYGLIEGTTNIYPKNLEETLYIFGEKGTVKAGGKSVNIIEEWSFSDQLDDSIEVKENINIGLVNELAILCNKMDINIWEVIDAAKSKPYGFQAFYPGPGLGGHCIPLDPYYLSWKAREYGFHTSMIESSMMINDKMPEYCAERTSKILNRFKKAMNGANILVLGVAYKQDIDDYRESPAIRVINELEKEGSNVVFYDPFVAQYVENGEVKKSEQELTSALIELVDIVVVTTAHTNVDYNFVQKHAKVIFDTKNAMKNVESRENIELL